MVLDLGEEKTEFYENLTEMMKAEIDEIQEEIESELADVKERITDLNELKQHARQVYDGACARLGRENEFAELEEEEEGFTQPGDVEAMDLE